MTRLASRILPLGLAAALAASAGVAFAQSASVTLGDRVDNGQLSQAAFVQLIADAGVSADEARAMTLQEIVRIKWTDD